MSTTIADGEFQPVHSRKKKRPRKGVSADIKPKSFATQVKKSEEDICDTQWLQDCQSMSSFDVPITTSQKSYTSNGSGGLRYVVLGSR